MHTYCTLFDKNYLIYGLALHASLKRHHAGPFRLYMLAMDKTCESALRTLNLENVIVVPLDEVVTPKLAWVYERMSFGQICWTSQPLLCKYVLAQGSDEVTYLEADSYFFADPQILFDEIGSRSVSLVPHHYAPGYDQTATSGVFCVQFNLFRNDAPGRELLDVWEQACLKYDKQRSLWFPGQLCLDDWPSRSQAVCVVQHPGAGVAPWNVSRYRVGGNRAAPTVNDQPVVFYHFHQLALMDSGAFFLSTYTLGRDVIETIYRPYLDEMVSLRDRLRTQVPGFDYCKSFRSPGLWASLTSLSRKRWLAYLRYWWWLIKYRRNIIRSAAQA